MDGSADAAPPSLPASTDSPSGNKGSSIDEAADASPPSPTATADSTSTNKRPPTEEPAAAAAVKRRPGEPASRDETEGEAVLYFSRLPATATAADVLSLISPFHPAPAVSIVETGIAKIDFSVNTSAADAPPKETAQDTEVGDSIVKADEEEDLATAANQALARETCDKCATWVEAHQPQIRSVVIVVHRTLDGAQADQAICRNASASSGVPSGSNFRATGSLPAEDNSSSSAMGPGEYRVLLVSITDLKYPVDIDVLHRLFNVHGVVEKVVTFVKQGSPKLQAFVQMADSHQAARAADALNDKCIYDGCNKLQIQASKLRNLVVKQNNCRSWDFTIAPPPTRAQLAEMAAMEMRAAAASSNLPGALGAQMAGIVGGFPGSAAAAAAAAAQNEMIMMQQKQQMQQQFHGPPTGFEQRPPTSLLMMPHIVDKLPRELQNMSIHQQINPSQTPVVILYKLPVQDITVAKLFNLLSIYGHVVRIKLLRGKPDSALCQFTDPLYATMACHYLLNAPMFGTDAPLHIGASKNSEVTIPPNDDGRTATYTAKDQRADDPEKFLRSVCKPTPTLFLANLHEGASREVITGLLAPYGTVLRVEIRPAKPGARRLTAIAQMASDREALTALCHLHNYNFMDCNIKLAFSKQILLR